MQKGSLLLFFASLGEFDISNPVLNEKFIHHCKKSFSFYLKSAENIYALILIDRKIIAVLIQKWVFTIVAWVNFFFWIRDSDPQLGCNIW